MWLPREIVVDQNGQFQRSYYFYTPDAAGVYINQGGDDNLVPYDFTGATLKMQVRQTDQSTSTLLDTYGTATGEIVLVGNGVQKYPSTQPPAAPAYNNGFQLTIPGPRTAALAAGVYFYDVLITLASGVTDYIMGGRFEVVARQTR